MVFFTNMVQQTQAQNINNPPAPLPIHNPPAQWSHVKMHNPEPYDGSDPAKLHLFLSQCKLVFRSCNKAGWWPTLFLTFPLLCGCHFITLHYSTLLGTYGGRWWSLCHTSFVASSLGGCVDLIMTFSVCGNCCHAILFLWELLSHHSLSCGSLPWHVLYALCASPLCWQSNSMCALLYSTLFFTSWLWPYTTCGSMCWFLTLHYPILDCGHTLSLHQCGDCLMCVFLILYLYNVVGVDCGLHFVFTPQILHVTWVSKTTNITSTLLCMIYPLYHYFRYRSCPDEYHHDSLKIMYTVLWLKGTAQWWYEPILSLDEEDLPDFSLFWWDFEEALQATFGEPDHVASAMLKLDNLIMKDWHHINKYNVNFNEYSTLTGFNEHALYAKYYKGLVLCIKDALVYSGCPVTLNWLWEKAQELDLHYWECKNEEHTQPSAPKALISPSQSLGTSPAMSSDKTLTTHSGLLSRLSTPTASSLKPNKLDLSKVLCPDSKLLPEEKDHCKQLSLCFICTSEYHMTNKCPSWREITQEHPDVLDSENSEDKSSPSEAESSDSQA